jgi:hypothetical protein
MRQGNYTLTIKFEINNIAFRKELKTIIPDTMVYRIWITIFKAYGDFYGLKTVAFQNHFALIITDYTTYQTFDLNGISKSKHFREQKRDAALRPQFAERCHCV